MNKPAPKEPSMDEILSSIRQIIADDDAATAPRKPTIAPAASAPAPTPPPLSRAAPPAAQPAEGDAEPLALTPEQMLRDETGGPAPISFSDILGGDAGIQPEEDDSDTGPQLVDPEDITFDAEDGGRSGEQAFSVPVHEPEPEPVPPPRPAPPPPRQSVARTAPMPDPTLSSDMAERLLEPTTDAAVKHTFAKLSGLSMAGSNQTIDALLRDILRPMLKEWLDENLPAIVERMVEKEIARISRGGE